jgi:hypothetical protein
MNQVATFKGFLRVCLNTIAFFGLRLNRILVQRPAYTLSPLISPGQHCPNLRTFPVCQKKALQERARA